jgi:hypothetical protein
MNPIVRVMQRLLAGGEIDDAQPRVTERDARIARYPQTCSVRSAVM